MITQTTQAFEEYIKKELVRTKLVPILWDNVGGEKPNDGYVRPFLLFGGTTPNSSIGSKKREEKVGIAHFQIFSPKGKGNRWISETADIIEGIFRDQTLDVQTPQAGSGGGLPVNGLNQKKKLLSAHITFYGSMGPARTPPEGEFVMFPLKLPFKAVGIYGVDN